MRVNSNMVNLKGERGIDNGLCSYWRKVLKQLAVYVMKTSNLNGQSAHYQQHYFFKIPYIHIYQERYQVLGVTCNVIVVDDPCQSMQSVMSHYNIPRTFNGAKLSH